MLVRRSKVLLKTVLYGVAMLQRPAHSYLQEKTSRVLEKQGLLSKLLKQMDNDDYKVNNKNLINTIAQVLEQIFLLHSFLC